MRKLQTEFFGKHTIYFVNIIFLNFTLVLNIHMLNLKYLSLTKNFKKF